MALLAVFRLRGFPVVVMAIFGLGLGLGSIDIVVTERAVRAGTPAAAGWILTAVAFGSIVGGLIWGRVQHRRRTPVQLASLLLFLAAALALAAVATNLAAFAGVLAVAGIAQAPAFIVAYVAVERLTPVDDSIETNTWISTANDAGVALGPSTGGILVDKGSSALPLLLGSALLAAVAATVLNRSKTVDPSSK